MSRAKHKDSILETIDQLRKRKARPDQERICHMAERKYGLSFEETLSDLDRLVEEEIVIKVDYKGSTSYRNAAKWKKSHLIGQVLNSIEMGKKLQSIVLTICEEVSIDENPKSVDDSPDQNTTPSDVGAGASAQDIEEWLLQNDPDYVTSKIDLHTLLDRELQAKHLDQLPNGNYVVADMIPDTPVKTNPGIEVSPSTSASSNSTVAPTSASKNSPGRKGRPPTKRKKIKKSLGPDFEHYSVVKKKRGKGSSASVTTPEPVAPPAEPTMLVPDEEPRCDYCLQTSASNRKGDPEDLLICKDCQAKAHPSCMDYSEELAKRARLSPWQCIDCKTCYICEDSGDPDAMLFCDACDKGYHMSCHNPPVDDKPTGKWVCSKCMMELGIDENDIEMDVSTGPKNQGRNGIFNGEGGPSCLPTPSDSPVNFQNEADQKESLLMNGDIASPVPLLATTLKREVPDASDWSIEDVVKYFMDVGFHEQSSVFREQEIDGKSLLLMKRSDVLTGLSLKLGPALKIYAHVQRLQTRGQTFF